MAHGSIAAPWVVVALSDRAARTELARALEDAGCRVRTASRPAELAKALRDGVVRLVVIGDHADDVAFTTPLRTGVGAVGAVPWLTLAQHATMITQRRQILDALAERANASVTRPP
jgi:DNA-binding NtrC family response regulator